jgi:hypothetical protein
MFLRPSSVLMDVLAVTSSLLSTMRGSPEPEPPYEVDSEEYNVEDVDNSPKRPEWSYHFEWPDVDYVEESSDPTDF